MCVGGYDSSFICQANDPACRLNWMCPAPLLPPQTKLHNQTRRWNRRPRWRYLRTKLIFFHLMFKKPEVQKSEQSALKKKIQTELHVRLPTQPLFAKGIRKSLTASLNILVFHTNLREFPLQEAHLAQKIPNTQANVTPFCMMHFSLIMSAHIITELCWLGAWEEKWEVSGNG